LTPTHPLARLSISAACMAFALSACGRGGDGSAASDGPLPPGLKPIEASARLTPPTPTDRCYSPPVREVFRTRQEWDNYWTDSNRGCTPPPLPAGVDFAKEMLVYATMGRRMSSQERMTIDGSGVRNDTMVIFVRRTMLKAGCPASERTFPQSLVRLPADTRPVRFAEEHHTLTC
jgi:hypothetical protein